MITSSTCASVIVRGCPGRGSSVKPSRRASANRVRHFAAVARLIPRRAATSVLVRPSAAVNTIRDRNANACALDGRRDHDSNCSRSPTVSSIGTANGDGITPPFPPDPQLI
jgi:hypothetical protein